jgi:hypothetical protein
MRRGDARRNGSERPGEEETEEGLEDEVGYFQRNGG